jgi:hypothetical protein
MTSRKTGSAPLTNDPYGNAPCVFEDELAHFDLDATHAIDRDQLVGDVLGNGLNEGTGPFVDASNRPISNLGVIEGHREAFRAGARGEVPVHHEGDLKHLRRGALLMGHSHMGHHLKPVDEDLIGHGRGF